MLKLFGVAIFLSAALLFLVQPMSGKVLLPLLGGSPAVWNTCMVFFQGVLLLGYGYAHFLSKHVPLKWQPLVHVGLLIVAGVTLPAPVDFRGPGLDENPVWWVVNTLGISIGLPFLVVSTSGPLLQRWFSRTNHPQAKDPYFLYAASNAGSVLGLLVYPFVIEPALSRGGQSLTWTVLYWTLAPLIAGCAWMTQRTARGDGAREERTEATPAPTWKRRGLWVLLAFVPSSLMIGVTQSISTDVAAIPLLWIVPLLLYLVTFILAFSRNWGWTAMWWGRLLPVGVIALMVVMLTGAKSPLSVILFVHLSTFFVAAVMCHRRLAEDRPPPDRLTEFFLALSVGGVLGGIFNALVSPVIFGEILEYPLVLALACLLRPVARKADETSTQTWARLGGSASLAFLMFLYELNIQYAVTSGKLQEWKIYHWMTGPMEMSDRIALGVFAAGIPAIVGVIFLARQARQAFAVVVATVLVTGIYFGAGEFLLGRTRTFFGVIRVTRNKDNTWNLLTHGTTIHGRQARTGPLRGPGEIRPDAATRERLFWGVGAKALPHEEEIKWLNALPTSYYHPRGPIGEIIRVLQRENRLTHGGFVGMGAGSLAAYSRKGDTYDFFEIDQAVVDFAKEPAFFTYLSDANADGAKLVVYLGDGRLVMRDQADNTYDLIAVDAFSSDAIPVHLITREAVQIYMSKLRPRGVLAFHISNRYFDLGPVIARIASELKLEAWVLQDNAVTAQQLSAGKAESTWVAVVRQDADLGPIATYPTRWQKMGAAASDPLWTDDFANVLSAFEGWGVSTKDEVKRAVQPGGPPKGATPPEATERVPDAPVAAPEGATPPGSTPPGVK
ncbi:MAG: fused MFS/spermidine synthase [Phycisphaerales bacterium]